MSGKAAKRARQAAREGGIPDRLARRPRHGGLVVPFMVAERTPWDFKVNSIENIERCCVERLCGICGEHIEDGEVIAFIGPADGRNCFADPWMHEECARYTAQHCPFVSGRSPEFHGKEGLEGMRPETVAMLKRTYEQSHGIAFARACHGWRDPNTGRFHFEIAGQSVRRERIR